MNSLCDTFLKFTTWNITYETCGIIYYINPLCHGFQLFSLHFVFFFKIWHHLVSNSKMSDRMPTRQTAWPTTLCPGFPPFLHLNTMIKERAICAPLIHHSFWRELHNVLIWGKKREARALHIRHSFWRVFSNCTTYWWKERWGKKSAHVFLHLKMSLFFVAGFSRQKEYGTRVFFCLFCQNAHKKKLYMIFREFEIVVVRMY